MSTCTDACRATTGRRFEHCKRCHRTFSGASTGDAHSITVGSYALAKPTLKSRNSTIERFDSEETVPKGWCLLSVGNTIKRCLTDEEMAERKWRVVKGVVRGPESDVKWWKAEEDSEPAPAEDAGSEYVVTSPEEDDGFADLLDLVVFDSLPAETAKPIPPVGGMDLDDLLADWDEAAAALS